MIKSLLVVGALHNYFKTRTLPLFTVLLFSLLVGCSNTANKNEQVLDYQRSNADYDALVAKVKNQQASAANYDMLIKIYPLTSFYEPKNDREQAAKLLSQSAIQNGRWRFCLSTNQGLLALNYTSLTAHYGAAICAAELGDIALGKYHNGVLDNLIEAIWRTGSGQSPEDPFYITSSNDIYAFIQLHQLVAVGQSLRYVNKLPIQAIKVQQPESNRTFTWYFDITPQFRRGIIDNIEKPN